MMLGPKITYCTKYGAKVTMRYSLLLWLLDRNFAKTMKEMVSNAWEGDYDSLRFYSGGWFPKVLRARKEDCAFLKLSWF